MKRRCFERDLHSPVTCRGKKHTSGQMRDDGTSDDDTSSETHHNWNNTRKRQQEQAERHIRSGNHETSNATTDEAPSPPELTERQTEILTAAVQGLSNKDIGKVFCISPVSVKKHLSVIFAKIGASNRAEAVAIALKKHLLKE